MSRFGRYLLGILCFTMVGCGSYYVVKDPASGRTYYTTDIDTLKSGAVKLQDEKSGAEVTLQNSEVREVSSKEYKAGLKTPAPEAQPVPEAK